MASIKTRNRTRTAISLAAVAMFTLAFAVLVSSANAANVAINNETRTTPLAVAAGNWYQTNATGTVNLDAGGSIVSTDPAFEMIIMQVAAGTSTININTGGSMSFTGASANGARLFLGNANAGALGIINVNGGTFDGSGLGGGGDDVVFGRSGATGLMNIIAGTATFGGTPNFPNGSINFALGSTGTLTVAGQNAAYFEGLFNAGDLTFDGSNIGAFGDIFQVSGSTVSLVAPIPEPSTFFLAVLGLLSLGFIGWRRRRRA